MYGERPKVLLVAPPPVTRLTDFAEMFAGAKEKSQRLAEYFQQVAVEKACSFLDAASIVCCNDLDGIHLDAEAHRQLGLAMAARVREML